MTPNQTAPEPTSGLLGDAIARWGLVGGRPVACRLPSEPLGSLGSSTGRSPYAGCGRSIARPGSRAPKRGQALVEFALVLPLFLLFLAGLADVSMGFYTQMTLSNTAREAVRTAIYDPDHTVATLLPLAQARALATANGVPITPQGVTISCLLPDAKTACTTANGGYTDTAGTIWAQGDDVSVTVSYTYSWIWPIKLPMVGPLFNNTVTLSSTAVMILQ